ncbi:MAG TPA: UDP-N-acetylmuramoyl-L-alanyl-D-glutamate--2,6-diaminopimelate ligase [Limnobacter sp.]|uniref:UDP-N-acetylmuramoyl-L-alanyl-D-glutamate--2, 6-diaminopimelate ligase n=1 Tax=Limnobacter sp. TaxID=2003368 RepID=UPI002EDB7ED0
MKSAYLHSVDEVLSELHELGFFSDCSALVTDHRRLGGPRDVLLAVPGQSFDPRNLADDLLRDQRCGLVLVDYEDSRVYQSAAVLPVLNLRSLLAEIAQRYYDTARLGLTVYAVTGTNGKTTVTRWLAQTLSALGKPAAVIGTLGYGAPDALKPHSGLTTPDVVGMHHLLHELSTDGFQAVCVEASSIGLHQGRLAGVPISTALFTNLTQDHLDYHGTMQAYGDAKLQLATWPGLTHAVVNVDDAFGEHFRAVADNQGVAVTAVGRGERADVRMVSIAHQPNGLQVVLQTSDDTQTIEARVVGDFNAENLSLVYAALNDGSFEPALLAQALANVSPAPGRMQWVSDKPCVIVDYAHTPDALQRVLDTLRAVCTARDGRLLTLFGCGGDRDKTKRPQMGNVASQLSDAVWVTSDNPRTEDPQTILDEIVAGVGLAHVHKLHVEVDRVKAIQDIILHAQAVDVVLLAGKGHEQTQTVGRDVRPHSDVDVARAALAERGLHV